MYKYHKDVLKRLRTAKTNANSMTFICSYHASRNRALLDKGAAARRIDLQPHGCGNLQIMPKTTSPVLLSLGLGFGFEGLG